MRKPLCAATCLILATFIVQAADESVDSARPDNTEINKRDQQEQTLTPSDQSNAKSDLRVTQEIRKAIMATELSVNAKNIKIITRNGNVTLRGPVNGSAEKQEIAKLAKAVPGIQKLNNQLEVK